MHEYAHHFLDHAARLRDQQLARIDAEFEADLFAILNGIQAVEAPTAMYYFFDALARMEGYSKLPLTDDYESGSCRLGNVTNVTAFVGMVPMVLLDAAFGGGYVFQRNSASTITSTVQEHFGGTPPALDPGSCGRLAESVLNKAFGELRALALRMEPEAAFLLAKGEEVDVARARRLIGDLAQMATTFQYLDGVTTKSIALMLRRWGLEGRDLSPLIAEAGRVVDTAAVTDEFLSEDFGRLLQAQGLAVLQERVDLAPELRLAHGYSLLREAVAYNPAQSEAWINLAFVALKQGDCATAAEFAEPAANTATDEEQRKGVKFLAGRMREIAHDPELCRRDGAGFHPYQGL
jgi:hypothetical protein